MVDIFNASYLQEYFWAMARNIDVCYGLTVNMLQRLANFAILWSAKLSYRSTLQSIEVGV